MCIGIQHKCANDKTHSIIPSPPITDPPPPPPSVANLVAIGCVRFILTLV